MATGQGLFAQLGYRRTRQLLVVCGLGALGVLLATVIIRGVETPEVIAVALFIPIFLAFVYFDLGGGLVSAAIATLVYLLARRSAFEAVGTRPFADLIASRTLSFAAFGVFGGIATRVLRHSLSKLEKIDDIDDATGLYNARAFVETTDIEVARGTRYKALFSLVLFDIPSEHLDALSRGQRSDLMKELGQVLVAGMRNVDKVTVGRDSTHLRIAAILPETPHEGAQVVAERISDRVASFLLGRGVGVPRGAGQVLTYPEDKAAIEQVRAQFRQLAHHELPETRPEGRRRLRRPDEN